MESVQNPIVFSDPPSIEPAEIIKSKSSKRFTIWFILLGLLITTPVFAAVLYSVNLRRASNKESAAPFTLVNENRAGTMDSEKNLTEIPSITEYGDPATPMPAKVTIEQIQARSKPDCAVTSCNLDVGAGPEDPIPTSLKQILNAAGSDWNAPAEVILAFMYAEGYFVKSSTGEWLMYDWTEPNILAWSLPVEGTIVKKNFTSPCDDLNWGEQGTPSMFITDWDDPNRLACASPADTSLKCGIEKLVTGRGRYARRCNLLDSAYGLAKAAATAANATSCSWSAAQYAAALGSFTGSDPNTLPGSPYYVKMQSILTNCR